MKKEFSSVQFSHSVVSNSLRPHESQHARASLSITNSWSSLRLTSIEPVMPQIRISKDTGLTVEVVGKSPTLNVR